MNTERVDDAFASEGTEQVCARFEQTWRSGQRPRIEDFLVGRTEPQRGLLLRRLLLLEWTARKEKDQQPTVLEYCERFVEDEWPNGVTQDDL